MTVKRAVRTAKIANAVKLTPVKHANAAKPAPAKPVSASLCRPFFSVGWRRRTYSLSRYHSLPVILNEVKDLPWKRMNVESRLRAVNFFLCCQRKKVKETRPVLEKTTDAGE